MYCKNCGAKLDDIAVVCVKCGAPKGNGFKYCMECGSEISPYKDKCDNCGCSIVYNALNDASSKSDPLSVVGLILGIASVIMVWIYGIIGLACGIAAIIVGKIATEHSYSDKIANAAKKLGIAGIIIYVVRIISGIFLYGMFFSIFS